MSMLPNILEITQRGLELLGSGTLTVRNRYGLQVLHQSEVAFQFTLAPLGASAAFVLWSLDLERPMPSPQAVDLVGYTENGYKIEAHGHFVEVCGYDGWKGKTPKRADFYCETVDIRTSDEDLPLLDASSPSAWTFPLLGLNFNADYQIETKKTAKRSPSDDDGIGFGWSSLQGFSTVDWRDLVLRFDRTESLQELVRNIPVTGVVYVSADSGVAVHDVMKRMAAVYDLIAPRSGILWRPSLCQNAADKTIHYERSREPINGGKAYLRYADSEYEFITPYADALLRFYDSLNDGKESEEADKQQALRALARTLVAPMFPAEQSILATSTGFEILRSHFWKGEGRYRASKKSCSELKTYLCGFKDSLKNAEHRSEYEQGIPGKVTGLLSRPLKCAAVEIAQHYAGYRQNPDAVMRTIELRNQLIHRGMMDSYPDPNRDAMEARNVLWQSFIGLVGLRDLKSQFGKNGLS
jgi:hypothetical protein